MTAPAPALPSVLVVEDAADLDFGHFPVRFIELAEGFADLGCHTEALTALGWAHAPQRATSVPVHRYRLAGRLLRRLLRWVERRCAWRPGRAATVAAAAQRTARAALLAAEVRRHRRRLAGDGSDVVVVSVSFRVGPAHLAICAGAGAWVLHAFDPSPGRPRPRLARLLEARERRRARAGGRAVVAVHDPSWVEGWATDLPGLAVEHVPIAGARPPAAVDRTGARQRLHLPPDRFVVLHLGATHPEKDLGAVLDAMALLADGAPGADLPLLVVAGQCAEEVPQHLRAVPPPWLEVRPGTFDDQDRALLPVAADVVALSFTAGYRRNSGTLMDAVTAGTAVVVSDRSSAAEEVERLGIGVAFEAGDAESLARAIDALRSSGPGLPADVVAAARDALSNREVARRHLEAVGPAPLRTAPPAGAGALAHP